MRVAIVHDWFQECGGAEKVVDEMLKLFPEADLYALFNFSKKYKVKTSFLQRLPFIKKWYSHTLPLMPFAIEQFDLSEYDLVLSSSSCVSKGVLTAPHQLHICYCNTPMRYAWDLTHQYLNLSAKIFQLPMRLFFHKMRLWDVVSANRVDHFIANSGFIASRILKYYRREAKVIYPPVDTDFFEMHEKKEDYYITVSRLVSYKRLDLIVEAFKKMPEKKLIVIGEGKRAKNAPSNIVFLGSTSEESTKYYLQRAKAFIFAGIEDFGIAPLEAQSCGTPVIAYERGGLKETIVGIKKKNPTGVFFQEQTSDAIIKACFEFEENRKKITPEACRENAKRFSRERFHKEFKSFIDEKLKEYHESTHTSRRSRNKAVADVESLLPQAISKVRGRKVAAQKDRRKTARAHSG